MLLTHHNNAYKSHHLVYRIVLVYPIDRRNKRKMAKPEIVFKVGAVRAAIFRNTIESAGRQVLMPKTILEVRYKDKTGQWQGSNSFSLNEIPKAILALQKVFDYLTATKAQGQTPEDESEPY